MIDLPKDKIGRQLLVDKIKYLIENLPKDEHFCLALDGEWGSGKTFVMEKLKEAYIAVNPSANIEVLMSDSTTGMTSAMEGTCDIGMASRDLSDKEKASLTATPIALDGIAVIVSNDNPTEGLTSDQVKGIYTGTITSWSELN